MAYASPEGTYITHLVMACFLMAPIFYFLSKDLHTGRQSDRKRGGERAAKAKEEWLLEVSFMILCYIILGWEGDSHFIPFQ